MTSCFAVMVKVGGQKGDDGWEFYKDYEHEAIRTRYMLNMYDEKYIRRFFT